MSWWRREPVQIGWLVLKISLLLLLLNSGRSVFVYQNF